MAIKNFSDTDRIFYSDGYRTGQNAAQKGLSPGSISAGIGDLQQSADGLIGSLLAQGLRNGVKADCTKGCDWCCHQPVFASNFEILHMVEYIQKYLPEEYIGEIAAKAAAKNNRVKALPNEEMLLHKSACPLLDNGSCTIYPARPMACRIYLSTSLESCRKFYNSPAEKDSYPALLAFPLRAGKLLNEGFMAAMKQHGLPATEYRLEEGLGLFLRNYPF
jgi:Fe-S-cluster containining protein